MNFDSNSAISSGRDTSYGLMLQVGPETGSQSKWAVGRELGARAPLDAVRGGAEDSAPRQTISNLKSWASDSEIRVLQSAENGRRFPTSFVRSAPERLLAGVHRLARPQPSLAVPDDVGTDRRSEIGDHSNVSWSAQRERL